MKKLYNFLVLSLIIHIIFLYLIKLPKEEEFKKKEPIYVDVIKKSPEKRSLSPKYIKPIPQTKPIPQKRIIPDKFVQKDTPKIPDVLKSEKDEPIKLPEKIEEDTKPIKEPEQPIKKEVEELKPQQKNEEIHEKPTEEKKKLSKEQLAKILNPKDIINEIAKNEQKKEDEVDFNKFEVKYTSYFYKFKQRLYNVWKYPSESAMKGEQGTVRIKFTILKDGTITNINVVSSSGYSQLDRAAVDALKNMGKVPLPDSFGVNILNVDGYFIYYLGGMWIR